MIGPVKEALFIERSATIRKDLIILRKNETERFRYLLLKRSFDMVISSLVIVLVLSWLIPLLAIIIRLDSKGGVFFIQRRVGYRGRSFPCIKLRTMYVNKEAHSRQAVENDIRITRVGDFLRKSNLDELPQFINVLLGQMSIVGPRPHMHKDCTTFAEMVETYEFRHLMRPGITGLAQVKGYRGPAQHFESIFRRYQWDAFYIRNAGFWLDLRIMYRTAIQTLGYFFNKLFSLFGITRDARVSKLRVVR
jgi:putative colanic acid biosynthesis UDP-glucose lipid carrier transferase